MAYRSPKREQQKHETKTRILEAATKLFVEHGLDAPSLEAICAEAGCTRGAYYAHFQSRDELVSAAMTHALSGFVATLFRGASEEGSPLAFVDGFLSAIENESHLVGAGTTSLRFHHLLAACARHADLREQYVGLLSMGKELVFAELTRLGDPAADTHAETCIVILTGLLAHIDLRRPVNSSAIRTLIASWVPPAKA